MNVSSIEQHNDSLREHQIEAKAKIFDAWETYDSVMLQMPTGTGKTYLFTSLINDIIAAYKKERKEINILIVAHRNELLEQISATLSRFGIPHGFIQGSREQTLWRRVQVGSIMSLLTDRNYFNIQRQKFDFIIVDEAHHSLAKTYIDLFNLFPDAKKLGVTATPWRLNHESFLGLYQTIILSPQISWFINKHLLADFDYVSIKPNSEIQWLVNNSEIASTGDFSNEDIDNAFNNQRIRSKLLESYQRFALGRKGIIYAINKKHAANIAELYCKHGIVSVAIDCDTPKEERENLIAQFKAGQIKVLVNVEIFTEGFDCPDVNFIQLARPTRSLALFLQQVGRGLRIADGKEKTIILDNVGLYNYFGLPDADRKWKHHFVGKDDVESGPSKKSHIRQEDISDYVFDESKFDEDNEQMMIIRGAFGETASHDSSNIGSIKQSRLIARDFALNEYYLVVGHKEKFKIFPFVMKRGKRTDSVRKCVYEFDCEKTSVTFTDNSVHNHSILSKDIKLKTIFDFIAFRLGLPTASLMSLNTLAELSGTAPDKDLPLFNVLELISRIKPQQKI